MEIAELRSKIDMEKLYVEFSVLRTALSVATITKDLQVALSEPSKEGECRGACPKCAKEKSFSLNINTNRFNCFAKGCTLKGGGVIDFFAKLYAVSAKEASHLLAYIYGIQPYAEEDASVPIAAALQTATLPPPELTTEPNREVASLPPEKAVESLPNVSDDTHQSAQYIIASIEHQLSELKQLLATR
jgi:hypothetical protein